MSDARFADRLDAAGFAEDPVVGVYESDPSEGDALWLSERLFRRLALVAQAYELHMLPLLGGTEPVRLGREQCISLLDALALVGARLDDELAASTAQAVADYVSRRTRRTTEPVEVTFEGE